MLIYLCWDKAIHPQEITRLLKGEIDAGYAKNITTYLNIIETEGLMMHESSGVKPHVKKLFFTNKNKVAEIVIKGSELEKKFFAELTKNNISKIKDAEIPKPLEKSFIERCKSLSVRIKNLSKKQASKLFIDSFDELYDGSKRRTSVYFLEKKIGELYNPF